MIERKEIQCGRCGVWFQEKPGYVWMHIQFMKADANIFGKDPDPALCEECSRYFVAYWKRIGDKK